MQSENVHFENRDGQLLSGLLDLPNNEPGAYALFAHCFTCSKNLKAAAHIARALTDAGIAVLRFDFTGLGQSEGQFENTTLSSNVDDLLAAIAWLQREHRAPQILVGHSLGGTAVLQAAPRVPSAVAVATIGSPADPQHVTRLFAHAADELAVDGVAEVRLGGRPFRIRREFIDDLAAHDVPATIGRLRKALLLLHAPLDDVVDIDNASALFRAAKHPKSFVSLDEADHLLSREPDSRYAGQVLAAWASRYLPAWAPGQHADETLQADPGEVVARTAAGGFATELRAGRHTLTADEPASVGGTDLGPTPYDYLSAALAACTSMTLQMYARHKKLDLAAATVRVTHGRIHAEDCEDCDKPDGQIDQFRRRLRLDGELGDADRERMLEIADKCPVHRTLHNEIKIRTVLEG